LTPLARVAWSAALTAAATSPSTPNATRSMSTAVWAPARGIREQCHPAALQFRVFEVAPVHQVDDPVDNSSKRVAHWAPTSAAAPARPPPPPL
jgi:hypothetical protein